MELEGVEGGVRLRVSDDGVGLPPERAADAGGIRGLRERALSIDARLMVGPGVSGGTEIELWVPGGS